METNNSITNIDRMMGYLVDRYAFFKARLRKVAPEYISREVPLTQEAITFGGRANEDEKIQRLTVFTSWVYSNIILLGTESSAQRINVKERSDKGKFSITRDHPLAKVLRTPNEFFSFPYLLRHLIFSLSISRHGAFWYLTPDRNTGELLEMWPINANNIEPWKDKNQFVQKFLYTAREPLSSETRQFFIDKKFIFWVRYPNPWDYWASLPPLVAALFPAELDRTISENQSRIYGDSRGIPLSVVSLDPALSEKDFEVAKEQIIHDWQRQEASIAITRGGQLSIQSLGFTYEQLETIGTQEITRDKIDVVFFGYPYRSKNLTSGEGLKQMDRIIKEKVIRPLLMLIEDAMLAQIAKRFYPDDDIILEFDDPRTSDRALTIQENMIAARWRTMDDMREADGDPALEEFMGVDIGNMPVSLANNPSFLMSIMGLSGAMPQREQGDQEVGNLQDSLAPEAVVGQELGSGDASPDPQLNGVNTKSVFKTAFNDELSRWKKVSKRNLARNESRLFVTDIIPSATKSAITVSLENADTPEKIDAIFAVMTDVAYAELGL